MDIRVAAGTANGRISSYTTWRRSSGSKTTTTNCFNLVVPRCSKKDSPNQNGDGNTNNNDDKNGGDKFSTDWDKAWSNFKKQGKKTLFPKFSADKYVSWNPRRSDYPLSEEVDPIKRTERSNLRFWNSPTFTLGGAIVIVTFLLVYTISAPIK
ncbi:OLC1v1034678C1 [Oldenlandia corymbosa var. corymbosa]|uniref:OLC1v1034678C1 n=1 Tax=Oldenlandia corymbosa var. corymbosa TaxID=529605 RepID=A0AAV1CTQ9_OLDCO|nr:OLC1v1034678C1 [Oldenlandia corymbosa var. corymbosa]